MYVNYPVTFFNLAPIYARITVNSKRCEVSIKRKVPVESWSFGKGMAKPSSSENNYFTISNQKLNSYLKEIADLCQISKNITFHLARHTFATTITLTNGVPIESVSKMLGHSKISTTQIYAKVIEKKLGEDMSKLKEKLNEKRVG